MKRDQFYVNPEEFYQAMLLRTDQVNEILVEKGLPIDDENRTKSLKVLREAKYKLPSLYRVVIHAKISVVILAGLCSRPLKEC